MRWSLLFVALAGCHFDPGAGPRADAAIDAPDAPDMRIDMPPGPTCYERWLDNSIHFGTAVPIAEINSTTYDRDPFLPANELAIFWSSRRNGTTDNGEIWVAKRTSLGATFSSPQPAFEFNSTAEESKLSISADGKVAVVGSARSGGSGGLDVWESIRLNVTDNWPAMNRTNVMMLESSGNDHDPMIAADAQHLYYAPDNPSPQHLVVATRGGSGTFGAPGVLTVLNSGSGEGDPSATPDERILVFTSGRALTGAGSGDLWYSTRDSSTAAWGTPRAVPDVNTTAPEGDAHLSSDGCRIYFSRDLGGDNWDIFVANAQ